MSRRSGTASRAAGLGSLLALAVLVAGLPAALYAVAGSPIPHAIPAWHQITAALGRPDHGQLLVAVIRDASWIAWAAFTISALIEVAWQARGRAAPKLPVISPIQGFAAALVASALLGLIPGPHPARPAPPAGLASPVAAAAPPRPGPVSQAVAITGDLRSAGRAAPPRAPAWQRHETYLVAAGDNLWDIAAFHLGNGERWHEIYRLNRGRRQADGLALTDPDLIYPGWILVLPAPSPPPGYALPPAGPDRHRSRAEHPAHARPPAARHPSEPRRPARHRPGPAVPRAAPASPGRPARPVGVSLPGGDVVGITLAAAIGGALVAWRLHRRRAAVPRWPSPGGDEEPVPEAILRLRRAHLRSLAADQAEARGEPWPGHEDDTDPGAPEDEDDGLDEFGAPANWRPTPKAPSTGGHSAPGPPPGAAGEPPAPGRASDTWARPLPAPFLTAQRAPEPGLARGHEPGGPAEGAAAPPGRPQQPDAVVFGERDGAEISLDAVAGGGLGLTGPGAHAAARALLIGLLAAEPGSGQDDQARVVITEADLQQLLGGEDAARIPGITPGPPDGLMVTATLAAALGRIETEITRRIRVHGDGDELTGTGDPRIDESSGRLTLIGTIDSAAAARAQAVLAAGAEVGVTGIILGDWPAGTTCRIGADGMVLAASDPVLAGTEAFRLSAADTAAMLSLLRGAQGHVNAGEPAIEDPPTRLRAGGQRSSDSREPQGPAAEQRDGQPGGGGETTADAPRRSHAQVGMPEAASGPQQPPGQPPRGPAMPANHAGTAVARPAAPIAQEPTDAKPVEITVLGAPRLTAHGTEISGGRRKARELLAFLVLRHPGGASAEAISEALWPGSDPRYAARQPGLTVRNARQMLRAATGLSDAKFITLASDRYRLDPAVVGADLWRFDAALDRARAAAGPAGQIAALREAATLYQGPVGDGTTWDWAETCAEPARRRALDALTRLAELLQPTDPEQALAVLETALAHDPYNEAIYYKIIATQGALGRPDAASRTQKLLQSRLAELGIASEPATPAEGTKAGARQAQPTPPIRHQPGASRIPVRVRQLPGGSTSR